MRSPRWGNVRPLAAAPLVVTLISAALAVSACGSGTGSSGAGGAYGNGGGGGGYGYGSSSSASSGTGAMAQTAALKTETSSAGMVLADGQGLTLYFYSADKPHSGKSSCYGQCASAWPPLTGTVQAPSGVKLPGPIGSITRQGGVHQVTVDGYPLYTYADDKSPGQIAGNGMGGEWHVIKLTGASGSSSPGGMMKVELTSAGKVLANPHGLTVYYYTGDKPNSGTSSCTGACAAAWPPVVAPVRIPAGVKLPGGMGTIIRPGGVRQVTINGFPIYRYADDSVPGQAKGNGAEGEWHVIRL